MSTPKYSTPQLVVVVAVSVIAGGLATAFVLPKFRSAPQAPAMAPPAPKFVDFQTPTPQVKIRPNGPGFEVINEDPNMTGKTVEVTGRTETGELIKYKVTLPAPVNANAAPAPAPSANP